jgi:hypothetical protein
MKTDAIINHSVFGKLFRTDWDRLLGFREFPHLREFGKPDAVHGGKPVIEYLDKSERKLVENWRTPSLDLALDCRNSRIYSSLRSLGVFEMSVDVPNGGLPTPPQEAAYRHFSDDEQKVCATVVDALMRYYKFLRQKMPGLFDWLDAERRPDNPSVAEFGRICRFDKLYVCRGEANGLSPLSLSWEPVWDEEHGLRTIVFQGQVIMIGADDAFEFLADPKAFVKQTGEYGWGKKQMTKKEKDTLTTFVANYEPELEDDQGAGIGVPPWVIEHSAAVQRRQAEEQAQLDAEARGRKQDLANRMQAARDKAIHLGIASAADVDKVLHDLSSEEFRLHFGEFRLSRAFFKAAG